MKYLLILCLLLFPIFAMAQSITLKITAAESGEPLYNAHAMNHRTGVGKVSDDAGRINLNGEEGDTVFVSYVGYRDTSILIYEDKQPYNISLLIQPMDKVVIFADEPFNRRAAEGRQDVPMEFLEALPAFNGDPDIIKAITFLPGITAGKDGYSHMFVRGGDQDENLILLDGAPLYNVNHFGGFISMFHSNMIKSVDFYKGYWPSRFGGRLSSVMDIQSKSGNFMEHKLSADLSPLSTKAHLSGPIWKDKVSYMIGGRRTFIDLLLLRGLMRRTRAGERGGYAPLFTFYDVNGKIDARISQNQQLSFSAFRGSDKSLYYENERFSRSDNEYNIINQNYALNYSWYTSSSTDLHAHISSSFYRHFFEDNYGVNLSPGELGTNEWDVEYRHTGNTIRTLKAMIRGNTRWSNKWEMSYGLDHETLNYGLFLDRSNRYEKDGSNMLIDSISLGGEREPAYISSLFADGLYQINDHIRIKAGLRLPRYQYSDYTTWMYEPKILISYDLNSKTTMNASYNRQRQYSHLLSYTESEGYFREFYTTSDGLTPPSLSYQWSLGWFYHFKDQTTWLSDANFSIELFYKRQSLLNKFLPGIDPDESVVEYDDHLLKNGKAQTYGLEFLFQKTAGKFHGSLAYTYAHSRARYIGLNDGKTFSADFDYRHIINVLLVYKFRKGYQLSAQWDYRSGRPFTLSTSLSNRDDIISGRYPIVNAINNSRYPAYHRLDLSLDREWRTKKKGNKQWFGISLYNAYNHVNPFYAYPANGELKVTGFIPLIPSFHFGFEL